MNGRVATGLRRIAKKLHVLPEAEKFDRPQKTQKPLIFKTKDIPDITGVFFMRHRCGPRWLFHILKKEYKSGTPWVHSLLKKEYKEMKSLG